jgi:sugar lactone lactonase YvrE
LFVSVFFHLEQIILSPISINSKWRQHGVTVVGGNRQGNQLNQINCSHGMFIDDDQTIYVADTFNHRTVEWKKNAISGRLVVGRNGQGNRNDQLSLPKKVIVDKQNDSLIICDRDNRRVVRWPRQNGQSGEIIISNINCWDLMIDNGGYLYVSDDEKHEVRRWKIGDVNGTLVAGGTGKGNRSDQFNRPLYIFIDEDHSIYVSDWGNHRVMKWLKGTKEGIVVAGGQGHGNSGKQLYFPLGIIVDQLGSVYVADAGNDRVMRWLKGATEGVILIGGNGKGSQSNQFNDTYDLSFDRENNLYVLDYWNHRVQKI